MPRRSRRQRKKYDYKIRRIHEIENQIHNPKEDRKILMKENSFVTYEDEPNVAHFLGFSRNHNRRIRRKTNIKNKEIDELASIIHTGCIYPYITQVPEECKDWKCIHVRTTHSMKGDVTRHRVLIKTRHYKDDEVKSIKRIYTRMDIGNKDATYFVVTAIGNELFDELKDNIPIDILGPSKYLEFPAMMVRPLPNDVKTDEDALQWATSFMRGNNIVLGRYVHPAFYAAIQEFRRIELPAKIISSHTHGKMYPYLYTSPDGILVVNRYKSRENYVITKYRNHRIYKADEVNYLELPLKNLCQVLPPDVHGNFWDLETRDELNYSDCGTTTMIGMNSVLCQDLINFIKDVDASVDLSRGYLGYIDADFDKIIYDKFIRTINDETYNRVYDELLSSLKKEVTLSIYPILGEHAILNMICDYAKIVKIYEDDVRKLRVKKWLSRLSEGLIIE